MPAKDRETRLATQRRYRAANIERIRQYEKKKRNEYLADENFRRRKNARNRVGLRVHLGKWPKPEIFLCTDCGSVKAEQYHHEDYSQWWNVEPLCRTCHVSRHSQTESTD